MTIFMTKHAGPILGIYVQYASSSLSFYQFVNQGI
jgi:hypothetical protein